MKTPLTAGEHMREVREFDPYLKPRRLMDVLQLDIRQGGFLDNAELARNAASTGAQLIPHNWGSQLGVVMGVHLAVAAEGVPMVESDRSTCDVLVPDGYEFRKGMFEVPSRPGLGIRIDSEVYDQKCKPTEIVIT